MFETPTAPQKRVPVPSRFLRRIRAGLRSGAFHESLAFLVLTSVIFCLSLLLVSS